MTYVSLCSPCRHIYAFCVDLSAVVAPEQLVQAEEQGADEQERDASG